MGKIALSVVHHANQLVITNGYDNRDGISRVCAGYLDVLELHQRYGIPLSLHLSGTLVEAMLWHERPRLDRIRELLETGMCELMGGTYSEPIMPAISDAMNRVQLTAMGEIMARHFPAVADTVRTAWLPERVWDPRLLPVLTDPTLPQGPYQRVLVDDRLMSPAAARWREDSPFHWQPHDRPPVYRPDMIDTDALRPRTVTDGERRLTMVPISAHLRYLFPPRSHEQWEFLRCLLADLAARSTDEDPLLLVYADDMERAAGVGGWEPAISQYEDLLRWLSENEDVELVRLDQWLDNRQLDEREAVPAGSYYELEVGWHAGSDYHGWSDDPAWQPYARLLSRVETELAAARDLLGDRSSARDLLTLAERLLMLGQHETAWHDPVEGCHDGTVRHLAPWVRATAAHARLATPLLLAARWAAAGGCPPLATPADVDGDGETELLLANDSVWCVVSPRHGARLTMMCHSTPQSSALVVGNPVDHWNFQEQLHRFMDVPAAHPGALTDHERPHDKWTARVAVRRRDAVVVDLHRVHDDQCARRYALMSGIPGIMVCIHDADPARTIDNLLTPDYLASLTLGTPITEMSGRRYLGYHNDLRSVWVGFDPEQGRAFTDTDSAAGHGHLIRFCPADNHVDLIIGAGPVDDRQLATWLATASVVLHTAEPEKPADEPDYGNAEVFAWAAR